MAKAKAQTYDVVIVGAGPVGLTAALLLEQGGARVCLLEQADRPGDLPRAISIADETFRIMDRLGLSEPLKAESLLDTGSRYYGLNDRLLASSRPKPSRIGHPAKSQFDQPVLEELLWQSAVEAPGLDFIHGVRATAISQDSSGVSVKIAAAANPKESDQSITASWLLGADGGRSFVRDELGVELVGSTQQERWIVVDLLNVKTRREPYAEFYGNGKRPYVLVPGIKGRLRIEFMLFDDEDPDEMTAPSKILELVYPIESDVKESDIRRAVVYVAHQRVARSYRVGRAFLIGDAAHLMPPFSGQGLNAGLRDALNISWKLLDVLRGVGGANLLDTYETERRHHGIKMVKISRRTGAVVMALGRLRTGFRDVLFRTVSVIPAFHNYLAGMKFISPPDYSNGVAVRASRKVDRRLARWVGLALGQPLVSAADGSKSLLDKHLGSGWALVALGDTASTQELAKQEYWDALGAKRIRLVGAPNSVSGGSSIETFVDLDSVLAIENLGTTHWVLVRPDRYVAAVFTAESEAAIVEKLSYFTRPNVRSVENA